jgi:CheY-like chemotaxis protein
MMMCLRFGNRTQARVLVADWDRNSALTVAAAMHRAGFNAATAFSGKEAVAKAATLGPNVLVTEAYPGRLSGIAAAAQITAAYPDCKVLFLSGETTAADIEKAAAPDLVDSFAPKTPPHTRSSQRNRVYGMRRTVNRRFGAEGIPTGILSRGSDLEVKAHSPRRVQNQRQKRKSTSLTPNSSRRYFSTPLDM